MKTIKEIENMTITELEKLSQDEGITVPEGFGRSLEETVDLQCRVEALTSEEPQPKRRMPLAWVSVAASVAVIAGVGFGIMRHESAPKDTFSDPYLAYAEVEKAFTKMSDGMKKGMAMAEESQAVVEKASAVLERQEILRLRSE